MDIEEEFNLIEASEKDRRLTAKDLQNDQNLNKKNVSDRTIRRVLFDSGLKARRPQ